ncbi:MAG: type II toxin-antitoxin system VapC family toxin [Acetobacteraceae bacterium]
MSDRFKLTAYNAAYLELAQRRRLPLASLDQPLCRAANSLGLTVLGYTAG